ncbi:glycosyltransferase family 25 protein [Brucella anthropi]|uniref:glycosyltransferase family 25 protein n=1 Tax=Brucella anthropi TaxID=529 RepID=UPI00124E48E4|nr:glycosyltransferase family 25 protein [Brucella anthropi]KAB2779786.1 glycosyltransferase family 25 protein [Brucella anthropi]
MDHSVPVYVINLARSRDRWDRLKSNADALSIELRRVEAVEGKLLSPEELTDFDDAGFRIGALETIAIAPEPFAVIVEDDVVFTSAFQPFLTHLTKVTGWDAVKLVNHRVAAFRSFQRVDDQFSIGRCLHGPLGSSAAYVVTREGASKMLKALRPMRLPYDVALERGWAGAYQIFTTDKPVVEFSDIAISTIAQGRATYAKKRLPAYKRISTLLFRVTDYARRIAYSLDKKSFREGQG